jgi:hypothetical protein
MLALALVLILNSINYNVSYAATPSNQDFQTGTPGLYNGPYTLGDWRFVLLDIGGNERVSTNQEIAIASGLDPGTYALGVGAEKALDVIGDLGTDIGIKISSLTGDFKLLLFRAESGGGGSGGANKRVIGYKNNVAVAGATQDFTVGVGTATTVILNGNFENIDEFRIVEQGGGTDFGIMLDDITVTDPVLPVTGNHTATAGANTLTPVVGVDNQITLTVKKSDNTTDTDFSGAKNVTISGTQVAPNGSYGEFNSVTLNANSVGAGQVISVTFTNGVATTNLKLNKAGSQTIGFSIAGVTTPATNALTIVPTHGAKNNINVSQNITAPAVNGGNFTQQPIIRIRDAYNNICTSDNATTVTASRKDGGTWILTGTPTITVGGGIGTFAGLGATNEAEVLLAQLAFNSTGLTEVLSGAVTLPAPAGNHTATAGANTLTPVVGVNNEITLTVKNTLGNTDTSFSGAKNVTISGTQVAPNGSYGEFNSVTLDGNSVGAGQVISVTFINGVATTSLKLNKVGSQTIGFSIAGVTTPATNALTIVPTHGAKNNINVSQNITAPAVNGGNFTQQPIIRIRDAYNNICTSDNATTVTASRKDGGTWILTGTPTITVGGGIGTFAGLGATNEAEVLLAQLAFNSTGLTEVLSGAVTLPAPAGNHTATAGANTLTPVVGVNNEITLTVKNTLGNTDTSFSGAKDVTISGTQVAPDGSYGEFNSVELDINSAGAGQVISVTFTNGVATTNLKLNKTGSQTIGFIVATVTTSSTNTLSVTPTNGTAASMSVTQDITAPASNGGSFAQQPIITVKDTYGNICTGDNATVVTVAKEDAGTWNLTGTVTAMTSSGVATFTNLGATSTAAVNDAQLSFTATGLIKLTSTTVIIPAPVASSGGGSSGSSSSTTTIPSSSDPVFVIVNGEEQNAGTETKSTEDGKSTVTVEVNNTVIESKIDEAIKKNTTGEDNLIQVSVADTTSEVVKVELTGDIVKKLEENNFEVSVKWDNVEYIIPAEEFTISKIAENLGVAESDLVDIKIEVKITKLDESVIEKYNEVANASGAEIVFPPVAFAVVAKTTQADGSTSEVGINKFNNYVERVMEIPEGVDPSKITTGIVFNADGTYSHVPTTVYQKDGKWYAGLNSLTNSNYSVIWNPITVKSVYNHWAKDAVNDMASRLVIFNPKKFDPNKAITRADFAEYIVRALGLYREGSTHMNNFEDVSITGERSLAILIASEYGIIAGYPDETFRPDQKISREEAMAMYQRAMKITKLTGSDTTRYEKYTDYATVSRWAETYVKEVLSAHVFNGTNANTISPKSNLTYAEAAQAIKNLLVESKLINK